MNKIFVSFSYNDSLASDIVYSLKNLYVDNKNIVISPYDINESIATSIDQTIMDAINGCNIFICIFNSSNPNVMFELGYALAKNKNIILIGDKYNIPYDLKHFNYIKYSENIHDVLIEIENKLLYTDYPNNEEFISLDYMDLIERAIHQQGFIDNITYADFENIIYDYLNGQDLRVEKTTTARDQGYDFLLSEYQVPIQVKKFRTDSKISLSTIREMQGTMSVLNTDNGIIITSGQYTKSALNYVQNSHQHIVLLTLEDLLKLNGKFTSCFLNR